MNSDQGGISRRNAIKFAGATAAAAAALGASGQVAMAQDMDNPKLFFTDAGTGKNLMLLHGWTGDSHDWSWQIPALLEKYRVVAVDLRGHGASEVPKSGRYQPADYVSDLEHLISNEFGGEEFTIIGHSMGAQVAARLASKRPDLVEAIISVDGSLGFAAELAGLFGSVTSDLADKDLGDVIPPLFDAFYDPATPVPFKVWHARRPLGMAEAPVRESFGPLFLGDDQIGVGVGSEQFCRGLTLPVYHLCRIADQAEAMSAWFSNPKSKVEYWSGAGHWIQQDRPDDVNKAILAWLETLQA